MELSQRIEAGALVHVSETSTILPDISLILPVKIFEKFERVYKVGYSCDRNKATAVFKHVDAKRITQSCHVGSVHLPKGKIDV